MLTTFLTNIIIQLVLTPSLAVELAHAPNQDAFDLLVVSALAQSPLKVIVYQALPNDIRTSLRAELQARLSQGLLMSSIPEIVEACIG